MKKVTRCKDCANRMYDIGIGFTSSTTMICGQFGIEIEGNDGCTFGLKGEGNYLSKNCDVIIDGYAAVNDWQENYEI